jgi:hypothetical protein
MLCYGNPAMATIMDKKGRRFWYNPAWNQREDTWCHYSGMPSPMAYLNNED